jgi:type IV pilus assembly protein PilA
MNPPARINSERGSTLIELITVMAIVGILSAIGLPSFLGQTSKGQDAKAKSAANTASKAAETFFTDSESYEDMDADALRKIEPTLKEEEGSTLTVTVSGGGKGYTVSVVSNGGNTFSIKRSDSSGGTTQACTTAGRDGCRAGGTW